MPQYQRPIYDPQYVRQMLLVVKMLAGEITAARHRGGRMIRVDVNYPQFLMIENALLAAHWKCYHRKNCDIFVWPHNYEWHNPCAEPFDLEPRI